MRVVNRMRSSRTASPAPDDPADAAGIAPDALACEETSDDAKKSLADFDIFAPSSAVRHSWGARRPRNARGRRGRSTMDDKVLSYGDCLLRVCDVALLTGPHWLNDAVMSWYFEYLRGEGAQPDEPHADRVALVDASLTFLVANVSPDEARAVLAPLGVSRAHMALFLVRATRTSASSNAFCTSSSKSRLVERFESVRRRSRSPPRPSLLRASVRARSTTTTTSPPPAGGRTGAFSRTCGTKTRSRTSTARTAATTRPPRDSPRRSPRRFHSKKKTAPPSCPGGAARRGRGTDTTAACSRWPPRVWRGGWWRAKARAARPRADSRRASRAKSRRAPSGNSAANSSKPFARWRRRARANAANREYVVVCSHVVSIDTFTLRLLYVYFVFNVIPSRRARRARVSTRCPPAPSPRKTPPASRRT